MIKNDKPILLSVKPLPDFTIQLEYNDGIRGILTLKKIKNNPQYSRLFNWNFFKTVSIHIDSNDIYWDDEINLCKNASYKILKLQNLAMKMGVDPETLV